MLAWNFESGWTEILILFVLWFFRFHNSVLSNSYCSWSEISDADVEGAKQTDGNNSKNDALVGSPAFAYALHTLHSTLWTTDTRLLVVRDHDVVGRF